ncbi:hypothetical protein FACS1894218_3150 [Bacilli bacterium]|nr:hypothetical protein FACS1894218_3150 [Bacilli bacterium]
MNDNSDLSSVLKFVFVFESKEDKARLTAALNKYKTLVEISSSGSSNIEIMPPYITKGSALQHLCAYLNIAVTNTMPIGDELNDVSMLSLSRNSITLKSSKESVRKAAGHIMDSETSDIVGVAIDKYVLGK